ncbi:PREDICTED: contactin-5, partial [Nanorana parkeri]|uniref:contactin-5 n=1 Tax=Nanorana parkeri TaxID=125878 RepID=UPI0008546DAD
MALPRKLFFFLSVMAGCLSDFVKAVPGQQTSYTAILRRKSDSKASVLFNLRSRPSYSSSAWESNGQPLQPRRERLKQYSSPTSLYQMSDGFRQDDESVDYGPVFVQEPENVIFPMDSGEKKVALNCEARGFPGPSYRWLRNGTEIDLESDYRYTLIDGNLIISSPNEVKDSGQYQCIASNTLGRVLSREATLQFAYLGNFSGRVRSAVSVREGQGVVLMCSPPHHSPEITYSWVLNEYPSFVAEDSRRFISQETGNLYISKAQASDVGSYICHVKNVLTNTRVMSPPTPLTLRNDEDGSRPQHPPRFGDSGRPLQIGPTQPSYEGGAETGDPDPRQTAHKRKTARETSMISSSDPDDDGEFASWRECMKHIPTKRDFRLLIQEVRDTCKTEIQVLHKDFQQLTQRVEDIDGEVQTTKQDIYRLQSQSVAQAAIIRDLQRHVEDLDNRGRRNNIRIKGLPEATGTEDLPAVLQMLFNNILGAPSSNKIEMDRAHRALRPREKNTYMFLTVDSPVPTISWRKVNGFIPSKARLRKSQAVLEIPNVQLEDAGAYECKAENSRGKNAFRGQLQVYTQPQWIEKINDTQLDSGDQVHWECKASGKPRPIYRWLKNGLPLLPQNRLEMVNGMLTIHNISQSDAGMYQCLAENIYGIIYGSAELKVLASAPSFELNQRQKTIIITKGKEVIMECKPQASPKPAISWMKGDRAVRQNKRVAVLPDGSLRILNASKSDEGKYTCRGENVFGSAEITTVVSVTEPTKIELTPKRTELTVGESVVLSCKAIHDPLLDVSFFWTLNEQPVDFDKDDGHFENIRAQASSADLMIRNILLVHAGRYGCRVQTTADSVSDEAELLVRGPPGPPGVVIVEEITETTATLSWSPGADNHSPILYYNLQARSPFSLGWQTVRTVPDIISGDMESAMALDLNPWVEYEFRVVATNSIGTGDPSIPSRVIRTNEAVPKTPPANVSGGSGRRHELVITWEPVSEEFQNGEGFGYIVAFRPNDTRGWKEKMVTSSDASKFIYRDESTPLLTPFEVKVGVYNNKGDGPFSDIVFICSAEGEPSTAPIDVKATGLSASEILVSWKTSKDNVGRPLGFEVSYWNDMEQEEAAEKVKTAGNESSIILPELEGNTLYHITVRAFNKAGYGPPSAAVRGSTKKSPPSQAPSIVKWIRNGSHVSLGWEAVRSLANESDVMGYKVMLRQEGHSNSQVIQTQTTSAVVLLPDSGFYIIEVRAVSEGGDGTASSQIRVPSYSGKLEACVLCA